MAISTVLRHGWVIDHVLALSDQLSLEELATLSTLLLHLEELQSRHLRSV